MCLSWYLDDYCTERHDENCVLGTVRVPGAIPPVEDVPLSVVSAQLYHHDHNPHLT